MTLDEQLPIANWPIKSGEYKVVQLDINGNPHLRFAEESWETHAVIIMSLALKLRREYPEIEKDRGQFGKDKIPSLESEWYKVHGMGKSKVNVDNRQVSFHGDSFDYGIGINRQYLDSIRPLIQDWELE